MRLCAAAGVVLFSIPDSVLAASHAGHAAPATGSGDLVSTVLGAFFYVVLYFVPIYVALGRRTENLTAVALVDVFAGWSIIGWIVALVLALTGKQRAHYAPRDAEGLTAAQQAYLTLARDCYSQGLSPLPVSIALGDGEACYLRTSAEIFTVQRVTKYRGAYGGPSVRVARGVYLRLGGATGSSRGVLNVASGGDGTLYLTNQRFVFIGALGSTVIPFKKILDVSPLLDGIHIDIENGAPVVFGTGNQLAFLFYARIRDRMMNALSPDELVAFLNSLKAQSAAPVPPSPPGI